MISRISAVVIAIVIWFPSYGQLGMSDKDILEARKLSVKKNYEHIGVARILTGKHYTLKQLHAINSQLFREMNPRVGKLVYDGILFSDLVIQYDLSTQQVIVLLKSGNSEKYVSIDTEKVSWFFINGNEFRNLPGDSLITKGIYQVGHAGSRSALYSKRSKTKTTTIRSEQIIIDFIPSNQFYLKNKFGVFRITNKRSFLEAFQNAEEVRTLLKRNKIRFSKRKIEQGLILALSLLDPGPGAD